MKYWGESPVEEHQRHCNEQWEARERKEARERLSDQPCRAYIPPTTKMVFDRVEGNWTFYKHIPIPK